eukprot:4133028-Pleurochrysis_carterae.AAC.1
MERPTHDRCRCRKHKLIRPERLLDITGEFKASSITRARRGGTSFRYFHFGFLPLNNPQSAHRKRSSSDTNLNRSDPRSL